jgi:hypothetical protein
MSLSFIYLAIGKMTPVTSTMIVICPDAREFGKLVWRSIRVVKH